MSIHNGARLRHLVRREVPVQVRARCLCEHEVVRGVAGAHPPFGPRSSSIWSLGVLSRAPGPALQQPSRKTHWSRHTRSSVSAASSLVRFSLCPSCRGDAANPWLVSAFITHFGCVSHHRFVYFRRVSSLLCISVFFFCFRRCTRTHQCSRITESTVFEHIHHKDRRQLQLFQRLALNDRTASYVCARSRHICSISFCLYVPTERDKYVWLVQSRRRPEKWTRTRNAGSRGSVTPDPAS